MTLKEEIENAEKALDNMKSLHSSIAKNYGNELAGNMQIEEKELEDKITELKAKYNGEINRR